MIDQMLNFLGEPDLDQIQATPADESAVFLSAMQEACTKDEYNTLVMENATDLEMYGLIDDADVATESTKKIVYKQTKQQSFTREQNKMCMRMAKRLNLPEYQKYRKYIQAAKVEREKIRKKLGSKAKQETKRALTNAKRKASTMNSGNSDKLMKKISERAAANK